MSLVAYDSSDESECSDSEDQPVEEESKTTHQNNDVSPETTSGPAPDKTPQQGDCDDVWENDKPTSLLETKGGDTVNMIVTNMGLPLPKHASIDLPFETSIGGKSSFLASLPAPKSEQSQEARHLGTKSDSEKLDSGTSLLAGLPAPKPRENNVEFEEDELEDEVKPKKIPITDSSVPSSKNKKGRQPVKITVPMLPDSDSDEEGAPKKKKPKPSGKCGLFALLPAPKYSATKETKRVLLPYTLTKKAATSSVTKTNRAVTSKKQIVSAPGLPEKTESHAKKPKTNVLGLVDEDSDEDEESSSNFFSLGEEMKPKPAVTLNPNLPKLDTIVQESPTIAAQTVSNMDTVKAKSRTSMPEDNDTISRSVTGSSNADLADAPLNFKTDPGVSDASSYWTYDDSQKAHTRGQDEPMQPIETPQMQYGYAEYNQTYTGQYEEPQGEEIQEYMKDENFRRLQGKHMRGKEQINIIDVSMDDQLHGVNIELTKTISEEQDMKSHSKKKGNLPTSQQKRKHQITYLAFQAKEKEFELKNQWAANRQTKRQTQSKYGF